MYLAVIAARAPASCPPIVREMSVRLGLWYQFSHELLSVFSTLCDPAVLTPLFNTCSIYLEYLPPHEAVHVVYYLCTSYISEVPVTGVCTVPDEVKAIVEAMPETDPLVKWGKQALSLLFSAMSTEASLETHVALAAQTAELMKQDIVPKLDSDILRMGHMGALMVHQGVPGLYSQYLNLYGVFTATFTDRQSVTAFDKQCIVRLSAYALQCALCMPKRVSFLSLYPPPIQALLTEAMPQTLQLCTLLTQGDSASISQAVPIITALYGDAVCASPAVTEKLAVLSLLSTLEALPPSDRGCVPLSETVPVHTVLRALELGLIEGMIDGVAMTLAVTSIEPRVMSREQVLAMAAKLRGWASQARALGDTLRHQHHKGIDMIE
ncbi:hypothetical protein KIPB_005588 [Kipferlia bialata]|uniref:PCI domain-containing protein n=1 Tax=Kipferlia bialata TaxID=797122 RepID=A0A9K3CXN2_9EUKA|nr:hypothetical protein KIPB_005588 [Kipferlia bialata]|eukprot:g5588.t1